MSNSQLHQAYHVGATSPRHADGSGLASRVVCCVQKYIGHGRCPHHHHHLRPGRCSRPHHLRPVGAGGRGAGGPGGRAIGTTCKPGPWGRGRGPEPGAGGLNLKTEIQIRIAFRFFNTIVDLLILREAHAEPGYTIRRIRRQYIDTQSLVLHKMSS